MLLYSTVAHLAQKIFMQFNTVFHYFLIYMKTKLYLLNVLITKQVNRHEFMLLYLFITNLFSLRI